MNEKIQPWAVVGATMVTDKGGVLPIDKVYKNGNIVVKGQQYRTWKDGSAQATGDRWTRSMIWLATPERLAEAARKRDVAQQRNKLWKFLDGIKPNQIKDDDLKRYAKAIDAFEAAMQETVDG